MIAELLFRVRLFRFGQQLLPLSLRGSGQNHPDGRFGNHIHALPGRVRADVYGVKGSKERMSQATAYFSRGKGIISVKGCSDTGRVLLTYDEEATSPANSTL
ncbi:hypothetical protein [Brevibacillus thermoruber]|uniref:hypothetical protein n=1 Tax=Brevibacillus thermoruber TaxID=33942 RepID=UPI0012E0B0FD|nr:hypothetical protein [Brevibacillus thermoruber]